MAGNIEKKVGGLGEGLRLGSAGRLAIDEKRCVILESKSCEHGLPMSFVSAAARGCRLPIRTDEAGGLEGFDQMDLPAKTAETEGPLEEGPGVASGGKGVASDADGNDDARHGPSRETLGREGAKIQSVCGWAGAERIERGLMGLVNVMDDDAVVFQADVRQGIWDGVDAF